MSISYKETWFLFPPCSVHLIHRSKIDHNHAKEEWYYGQKRSCFIYCCNECALISPITFVSCGWISLHCMSGNQLPNGRKTRESATQDLCGIVWNCWLFVSFGYCRNRSSLHQRQWLFQCLLSRLICFCPRSVSASFYPFRPQLATHAPQESAAVRIATAPPPITFVC